MIFKHAKQGGGVKAPSLITHEPPLFIDLGAAYKYSPALAKALTFKNMFADPGAEDDDKFYQAYRREEGLIYVPPAAVPPCDDDRRSRGIPVQFGGTFKAKDAEQQRVVDESTSLLLAGRNHIIEAPTGFGKTYVGSAIALNCKRSTLIVVNKEMIIGQWVEAMEVVLGLHRTDIGLIQGDKCNVQGRPVVIAMLQSLCKPGRYPSWVYEAFGLAIFDEVHRLGSDYFTQVMWNLSCRSMIGLSARPERKDRRERLFKMFIGPTLVKSEAMPLPFKVLAVDTPYKLPRRLVVNKLTKEKKLTKVEPPHGRTVMLEKGMIKCHGRTQIAVKLTCISAERGRRIILFFTTLDYMKAVGAEIAKVLGAGEVGYLTGGMKEAARQEAAEKTVLCTTYQMTSEAVNLPWFDTAVLVSPKSDVLQVVGRILRPYEGKKDPTVIDLVDRDSTVLTGFHNQRMKFYKSKQAPVKKITI
jgi:superfamily II DNA or RNA helicase